MSVNSPSDYLNTQDTLPNPVPFVVGIGASAGGLEAINQLFDAIQEERGYAFVIIQHLSPNHESLMDELLAKHTSMRIEKAREGQMLRPNHIYLIPNRSLLTVKNNRFRLLQKPHNAPSEAIDVFFSSLAEDQQDRSIGIVLSGTGSDGSQGIQKIKECGGTVIVQEPSSAKFNGMPNSAIGTGVADLVLSPEEIGRQLYTFSHRNQEHRQRSLPEIEQHLDHLQEVVGLVREHTPHDFSAYKEQTLYLRVRRRMSQLDIDSFQEYIYYLKNHPEEIETLGKEFLIGVTRFFRDEEAFNVLREQVIPELVRNRPTDGSIKIWVTACSTGEEAYSIAMLLCDELKRQGKSTSVKIFATDIDSEAVEFAARGTYPLSIGESLPPFYQERFFSTEGDKLVVQPNLRRMVIFAQHNIIKDPPFSKVDLVSCRNMLIYMKPALQNKVLATLHFALNMGGYLFLGSSESCDELTHALKEISKKWNIYQVTRKSKNFVFNGNVISTEQIVKPKPPPQSPNTYPKKQNTEASLQEAFTELLLEEQGYAVFFTDENLKLIQALGNHKKFLRIPDTVLDTNLSRLLPKELALGLNLAVRRALRTGEKVTTKRLEHTDTQGKNVRLVSLVVKPFLDGSLFQQKVLTILLRDEGQPKTTTLQAEDLNQQQLLDNRQLELEEELRDVRQELRATVEELETSNEEMQSSNEELLSSNEELQSTNEELQSLNEELHTVNAEHQQKILELQQLNDDLNNYLRSTEISQIFLDEEMRVRKFTPAAKSQINLMESDLGRPISHFTYNFKSYWLVKDVEEVMESQQILEREIETKDDKFYLMKILPYFRHDGSVAGSIITFVDVTRVKTLNNLLSGIMSSSPNGILAFSVVRNKKGEVTDLQIELANTSTNLLLGFAPDYDLTGKRLSQEITELKKDGLFKKVLAVDDSQTSYRTEWHYNYRGQNKWLEIIAVPTELGIMLTLIDITQNKEAEAELQTAYDEVKHTSDKLQSLNNNLESRVEERTRLLSESEERFRLLSRSTNDAVWDWNLVTGEFWWNEGFQEIFGYQAGEIEPGVQSLFQRLHPEEVQSIKEELNEVINQGSKDWTSEHLFRKANGSYAQVYNRGKVLTNEYGVPYRMLGSIVDISALKETQEALRRTNRHLMRTNQDLDNFVYTASHDLRAPVANLTGLMSLLTPPLNNTIDGKDKHLMTMVNTSVQKLKRIIDSLLEVTQAQKDLERNLEWISLQKAVDDIKSDLRKELVESKAKIRTDFQVEEICYTYAQLRSILFNLISNSIKYRSPNRKPVIHVRSKLVDDFVLIEVEDNGLGMDQRSQDRIFTMFRRFHSHIEGTGIGLYIIKRIIESNEGSISVESKKDVGTTFQIKFKRETPVKIA